ncbi:30S ribosome-binding factor RbfA [Aggregatilinea lenta]|uniref:30S ribosome-binding factor RbfA n=1 Tax=Aggregatilinea lenta TaxID=913108 RepID=UPI000E5A5DD0|nr:30S ribosome-binding factor RbfA [Aggregatilinea lenta]
MTIKQERAARLIQDILSTLLMIEVTDPALDGITVTGVKVDREIEYADVYVHVLDEERRDEVMAGLQRASGFLRHELAQRIRYRNTPVLHFHWDVALERGERIDSLLDQLNIQPETPTPTEEQDSDEA